MKYSNFLGYLLSVSFRLFKKKIDTLLKQYNLTAPQWGVLSRLYENDGLTLVEISNKLYSEPSTIKLIIDKLENKGLIYRVVNEHDKRVTNIFLTEDAKILEQPLKEIIEETISSITFNFSNQEIQILKNLLKKLIKNLSEEVIMSFITDYKVELFPPPCLPGSVFWSAKVSIDKDLSDFLPYLNGYIKKKVYQPKAKTLVFNFDNHKISIRPNEIKIRNLKHRDEGLEVANKLIKFINNLWEKKETITPDYNKKEPPKVLDIYKILPKTNCGKCGEVSCFVFATKLSQGNVELFQCTELNEENKQKIENLFFG